MQTTLRLDDDLYRRAKAKAAATGRSLTKLLEDALRDHLHATRKPSARRVRLPVCSAKSGFAPGFRSLEEAVAAADLEADRRQARQAR